MVRSRVFAFLLIAALALSGCTIQTKHEDGDHNNKDKNVKIETPMGGLSVRTDDVQAKDAGMTVYPGATPKARDNDGDDKKANVNIDTPWFGLKVIALSFESQDSQEKLWEYYKKELSQYGRVLECRPGSPDLELKSKNKEDLTCKEGEKDRINHVKLDGKEMQLKVGTQNKQRIVAIKPSGSGTEFGLVYVQARDKSDTL